MISYVYIYNYLSQLAQVVLNLEKSTNSHGSGAHSTRLSLLIPKMSESWRETRKSDQHSKTPPM